jgi:hypothetical protein
VTGLETIPPVTARDEIGLAAEEVTLRRFVEPSRRERLARLVRTKKRYGSLERELSHGHPWDPRWVTPVPPAAVNAEDVGRLLRAHGAPDTCHVLGGSGDVDGLDLPLDEALERVVGTRLGALIICIAGELAYHEGEERGDVNILHRPG